MSRALLILFAAVAALACAPKDRDIRLQRLAAERRALDATFDRLEDRLVENQARVAFWQEMRDRHESVSAIACAVQDEHAEQMAARALPPEHAVHRTRVAAAPRDQAVERVPALESRGN